MAPSGASTGSHEALELRDNNKNRYQGKGVLKAVNNVNQKINYLLKNIDVTRQQDIDKLMIKLDDTDNKSDFKKSRASSCQISTVASAFYSGRKKCLEIW